MATTCFTLENPGTTQAKQGITYPKPDYGTGEQRALIEIGEYFAKAGDYGLQIEDETQPYLFSYKDFI